MHATSGEHFVSFHSSIATSIVKNYFMIGNALRHVERSHYHTFSCGMNSKVQIFFLYRLVTFHKKMFRSPYTIE
jgi:hypothetical protein